jgi:hypothetical protein
VFTFVEAPTFTKLVGHGRGKRGGARVIYLVRYEPGVIWMLTIYAKNVAESIPIHLLRRIRKEIENE